MSTLSLLKRDKTLSWVCIWVRAARRPSARRVEGERRGIARPYRFAGELSLGKVQQVGYPASRKRRAKLSMSVLFTSETAQNVSPDPDQRNRWYP